MTESSRLEFIETKLAHLESSLQQLGQAVMRQQREIEVLAERNRIGQVKFVVRVVRAQPDSRSRRIIDRVTVTALNVPWCTDRLPHNIVRLLSQNEHIEGNVKGPRPRTAFARTRVHLLMSAAALLLGLAACGGVPVQSNASNAPTNGATNSVPTSSSTTPQRCSAGLHCAP